MSSKLPLNLDALLRQRTVEGDRIEYKAGWHPDAVVRTLCAYPFPAIEEAVVNAVYHRSYEQREPLEVRVNPDGIEVVSYPGPDASIRTEALNGDKIVARRYRNRRIGEFLKELDLTEGRCTGIPTIRAAMAENGSPSPRFSTDETRTHFLVELPVHPQMPGVQVHDGGHRRVQTEFRILMALSLEPKSTPRIMAELGYSGRTRNVRNTLRSLIQAGFVELTIPDKPRSKKQEMRIAEKGKECLRLLKINPNDSCMGQGGQGSQLTTPSAPPRTTPSARRH